MADPKVRRRFRLESESADLFRPVLQILLQLRHELAGVGAIDDPMIEAQRQSNNAADGDGVVAVLVCQHCRLLEQTADAEDRRLRLVDDRSAELLAEDAGIRNRDSA